MQDNEKLRAIAELLDIKVPRFVGPDDMQRILEGIRRLKASLQEAVSERESLLQELSRRGIQ